MPQAVICAYARTPVGKHRGALSGFTATELGTLAVRELLRRANIDPASGVIEASPSTMAAKMGRLCERALGMAY